jgi:hypothetical protein
MKKQFIIILILTFILGLTPINFSTAITQNQIDAEVQIVCTDGNDNWFSGSGTIIDPSGIILTNRHVVEGAYLDICFIGFIESVNQDPNFGSSENPNLAIVKYKTMSDDMDAAILYLDNLSNKTYPYINIWNSNSGDLEFGEKIEVIGFPSIGGSTITYTSGDFSGFGSSYNGTQNYIKTTALLEHGNSGGAAYDESGNFIGIPTMVIAGTLNSMNYLLSVDSIKSWLSGKIGSNYQESIIEEKPVIETNNKKLQEDITPPSFEKLTELCYWAWYDNGEMYPFPRCFDSKLGKSEAFSRIQFAIPKRELPLIDEVGIKRVYYYFENQPITSLDLRAKSFSPLNVSHWQNITYEINTEQPGRYYFTFFAEDYNGNISNPYVYEYVFEQENHKTLEKLYFYRDTELKQFVKGYNVDFNREPSNTEHRPIECKTRLKNLTLYWEYPDNYNSLQRAHLSNSWGSLLTANTAGEQIKDNKYNISNINQGNNVKYNGHYWETPGYLRASAIYYAFYLKPEIEGLETKLDYHHQILSLIYDSSVEEDLVCRNKIIFVEEENQFDFGFSNKLKGQILLQVEENGEAYYVYPDDSKKYFLGRPDDAFQVMRELGLGATHDFISGHVIFPASVSGKILLDVEQNGEAYYIYPKDKKAYSLGRPADAFRIMRELGLGITNSDLNRISEGSL